MLFRKMTHHRFRTFVFRGLLFLCALSLDHGSAHMVGNNPLHQKEPLDPEGKFQLEWVSDWTTKRVNFTVTVETQGFVLFGLSKNGSLTGADVVIGGVRSNGKSYFSDRYGITEQRTVMDSSQDWNLHSARQTGTHTILSFSRPFDTCDSQDYPITDNRITLIWGYGMRDDENGLGNQNRGVLHLYLLSPNYLPEVTRDQNGKVVGVVGDESLADLQSWTITTKRVMPSNDTTYWCHIIPSAQLNQKQHIVGFDARFGSEEQKSHIHHLTIRRCQAPQGTSSRAMFEPFVNHPGQSCQLFMQPSGPIPTQYCTVFIWTWAIGGKTFFLPPHVGLPLSPAEDEYYIIQIHYDNPTMKSGLEVEASIDLLYSSNLRKHDGGMLILGSPFPGITPNILIPPATTNHRLNGHCGPQCTRKMLPETGINITAGFLHTHNSGTSLKIQLFRGDKELPTILSDNNFNNTFQQYRSLREEVRVLPGDQITSECVYDNTWTTGTVVGGLSTRQEMCFLIIIYYDQLLEYGDCLSEIRSPEVRQHFLGISNISWSEAHMEYVVQTPERLAGLPITEVSDFHVDWTPARRQDFARVLRSFPQTNICPRISLNPEEDDENNFLVTYPSNATPYQEEQTCSSNTNKIFPRMVSTSFRKGFNEIRRLDGRKNQFGWRKQG